MKIRKTGETIPAKYEKRKCDNCSMIDICMPKNTSAGYKKVSQYIADQLRYAEKENAETT